MYGLIVKGMLDLKTSGAVMCPIIFMYGLIVKV